MSRAAGVTLAVLLALVLAASAPLARAQPEPARATQATGTAPAGPHLAVATDPHVAAMLAQVDEDGLWQTVGDLSGEWPAIIGGEPTTIATRHTYSSEGLQQATQYAGERLQALGLQVEHHTWKAGTPPNVIGELPGAGGAEEAVIICGHLDNLPSGDVAPGADDNASGSTAVLAAAAILSRYAWTCDLRFALWTGEEQGLLGSEAYASRARNSGDQILGVVNLDMIAFNSKTFPLPAIDLYADSGLPGTIALANLFDGVVDAYGLALVPEILVDDHLRQYSDSWSFVEQGYAAILAIEDNYDFNPYYHSTADQLETLDMAYYAEFVRAAIATVAHAGCFPRGGLTGQVHEAWTDVVIPGAAVTLADNLGITYTVSSDGGGAYALEAMAGVYTATVEAPGYLPGSLGGVLVPTGTVGLQDLALTPIGGLDVVPQAIAVRLKEGQAATATLQIENRNPEEHSAFLAVEAGDGAPWLAVTPQGGALAAGGSLPVSVVLDTAGLAPGVYPAVVRVTSDAAAWAGAPVPVTLTVLPANLAPWAYLPFVARAPGPAR